MQGKDVLGEVDTQRHNSHELPIVALSCQLPQMRSHLGTGKSLSFVRHQMAAQERHRFIQDAERLDRVIGSVVIVFQLIELWVAEALAGALQMHAEDDRHLVSAAMSYRQKVDLLFELYARHPDRAPAVNLSLAKRALFVAEEFRNRIVHSVWAVSGEPRAWVRTKANLRGNRGLVVRTTPAKIDYLVAASSALQEIRGWEFVDDADLVKAIELLGSGEHDA